MPVRRFLTFQHAGLVLLLVGFVVLAGLFAAPVSAQSYEIDDLGDEFFALERQLQVTQQQLDLINSQVKGADFSSNPESAAWLSLRLSDIEEQLRAVTGQVEQIQYQQNQLETRFNNFVDDINFQLQELRGGGPGSAGGSQTGTGMPDGDGVLGQIPAGKTPVDGQGGDPQNEYSQAYNLLLQGDYDGAENMFRDFLALYSEHELAGNAHYWLGEVYYVQGSYKQAADAFLTGYQNYGGSVKAPDSLLKLGMSLAALGQSSAACVTFREIGLKFPDAPPRVTQRAELEISRGGC